MPPPEFFRKRGFFFKTAFLDATLCADLCGEVREASASPAEIFGGARGPVDRSVRNTWEVVLETDRARTVAHRIAQMRAEIADHFATELGCCEGSSFLVYRTGGFYRPHRDRASAEMDVADALRGRRVSLVLFLNASSQNPAPTEYAGGALTFYGLMDDPAWREYGFALDAAPGLLVAFPSDILHEVTPVTAGERLTIVDWFLK